MWNGGGDIPVPTPVSKDGLILITSAHGSDRPDPCLPHGCFGTVAKDAPDSHGPLIRRQHMQTPLIDGPLAYFCFDNGILTVYQLSTASGSTSSALAPWRLLEFHPSRLTANCTSPMKTCVSFVLAEGKEFKELAKNELGETVMATPAIAGGVLYIRGRNHLFAIGK